VEQLAAICVFGRTTREQIPVIVMVLLYTVILDLAVPVLLRDAPLDIRKPLQHVAQLKPPVTKKTVWGMFAAMIIELVIKKNITSITKVTEGPVPQQVGLVYVEGVPRQLLLVLEQITT
jgi:hypothetical protein